MDEFLFQMRFCLVEDNRKKGVLFLTQKQLDSARYLNVLDFQVFLLTRVLKWELLLVKT